MNFFYKSLEFRKLRNVNTLKRALKDLKARITGVRRVQSFSRAKVEMDEVNDGITKLNQLSNGTWSTLWDYVKKNSLPYKRLYDLGIGCKPRTSLVKPWGHFRGGIRRGLNFRR